MDQPSTTPAAPSRRPASRRDRRLLAGVLAALGVAAIALSLSGRFDSAEPAPARTGGSLSAEPTAGAEGTTTTPEPTEGVRAVEAKDPTNGPGGVGPDPEKTGLPAKPAEGLVRTGTADEGCFPDMRSYLEEWDRTGVEPDPCFLSQPASGQKQPEGVRRSYNGEKF